MKDRCELDDSGAIVSYFYGELPAGDHAATELHLAVCAECREQLEELATIRTP